LMESQKVKNRVIPAKAEILMGQFILHRPIDNCFHVTPKW